MARPKKDFRAVRTGDKLWEIVNIDGDILGFVEMQDWTNKQFKSFGYRYQSDFIVDVYYRESFGNPEEIEKAKGLKNYLKLKNDKRFETKNNIDWKEWNKQKNTAIKKEKELNKIFFSKEVPEINHNLIFSDSNLLIDDVNQFYEMYREGTSNLIESIFKISNKCWTDKVFEGYSARLTDDNQKFLLVHKETEKGYIFDLIDLINAKNLSLYNFLAQQEGLELLGSKGYNKTIDSFERTIELMQGDKIKNYPSLYEIIKEYTWFIEELATVGKEIILKSDKAKFKPKSNFAFYKSTRYFAEHLTNNCNRNIGYIKVSKLYNLVSILGFFNKSAGSKDFKFIGEESHSYDITYFSINTDFELEESEKIAEMLLLGGFNLTSLSRKFVKNIFGDEFARTIYMPPRKTNEDIVEKPMSEEESKELDEIFGKIQTFNIEKRKNPTKSRSRVLDKSGLLHWKVIEFDDDDIFNSFKHVI